MIRFSLKFNFNWNLSILGKNNKKLNNNFLNFLLFLRTFKKKFETLGFRFRVFWVKKNTNKIVFLKAAFKSKLPKHSLYKQKSCLFLKIEKKLYGSRFDIKHIWFYKNTVESLCFNFLPNGFHLIKIRVSSTFSLEDYIKCCNLEPIKLVKIRIEYLWRKNIINYLLFSLRPYILVNTTCFNRKNYDLFIKKQKFIDSILYLEIPYFNFIFEEVFIWPKKFK